MPGSCGSGVSLLVRDSMGCTALHLAANHGHTEVVSFILEHGECWNEPLDTHPTVFADSKFKVCVLHSQLGGKGVLFPVLDTITCLREPKPKPT